MRQAQFKDCGTKPVFDELGALFSRGARGYELIEEAGNQSIALISAKPDGFVAERAPDIVMRLEPTRTLLEILAAVRAGDDEVDRLLGRLRTSGLAHGVAI